MSYLQVYYEKDKMCVHCEVCVAELTRERVVVERGAFDLRT